MSSMSLGSLSVVLAPLKSVTPPARTRIVLFAPMNLQIEYCSAECERIFVM